MRFCEDCVSVKRGTHALVMVQPRAAFAFSNERGFTIIELIVAAAIVLAVAFVVLDATHVAAMAAQKLVTTNAADTVVEKQVQQWQNEAKSALAMTVEQDPTCSNGAQGGAGHPVAFAFYGKSSTNDTVSTSAAPNGVWTRYSFDGSQTLTRDVLTLDPADSTKTLTLSTSSTSIGDLTVRCVQPSSLTSSAPELHGANVHDYPVASPASLPGKNKAIGGNYVLELTERTASAARTVRLMSGTATTGVTVEGPQWHTIIWREDHTRRFYIFPFFTGQHSWLRIHARVDVSWDNWKTAPKMWCDWEAWEVYDGPRTFDRSDIPFPTEEDDLHASPRVPNLLPDTLMTFCRDNPQSAGSTTGTNQPPGESGTSGPPQAGGDDGAVGLPPYFIWQSCHTGTTWSTDPSTCTSASYNAADVFSCDPQAPWNCTVKVPTTPPQGWDQWCTQYSAQVSGSTNPPVYNGPDHQCAAPSPPPCDSGGDPNPTPTDTPDPRPVGRQTPNLYETVSATRSMKACTAASPTTSPGGGASASPTSPAAGPTSAPTPGPGLPCSPDSAGYCTTTTSIVYGSEYVAVTCPDPNGGTDVTSPLMPITMTTFNVYGPYDATTQNLPFQGVFSASQYWVVAADSCLNGPASTFIWSPSNPSVTFGDTYLPGGDFAGSGTSGRN